MAKTLVKALLRVNEIAVKHENISLEEVRELIRLVSFIFATSCLEFGYGKRQILRVTTKLRDAGRRSPPWKPVSSRVPGRPQDGADGNRISRWLMDKEHKFYADELTATLTEVKYFLQLLSMNDAPPLPPNTIQKSFSWLIEHDVIPGNYLDPIQRTPISLKEVLADARIIQSGHIHPLDRGGKHIAENTFLMLSRSNSLQGNLTLEELIQVMSDIVSRHTGKKGN